MEVDVEKEVEAEGGRKAVSGRRKIIPKPDLNPSTNPRHETQTHTPTTNEYQEPKTKDPKPRSARIDALLSKASKKKEKIVPTSGSDIHRHRMGMR